MAPVVTRSTPTAPQQPDRMLNALAWVELHRQHLLTVFALLLVAFAAVYGWRRIKAEREVRADAALLELHARPGDADSGPKAADYLKVAEQHGSTPAARRARLLAAAAYYADGHYPEAQAEFQRLLTDEGTGPLAAQAAFGIAACLDALDRVDQAAIKYQEVIAQFSEDSVASQARLALARINEGRQQPEAALRLYDEVLRDREAATFAQRANEQREALIRAHPELVATNAPASIPFLSPATGAREPSTSTPTPPDNRPSPAVNPAAATNAGAPAGAK